MFLCFIHTVRVHIFVVVVFSFVFRAHLPLLRGLLHLSGRSIHPDHVCHASDSGGQQAKISGQTGSTRYATAELNTHRLMHIFRPKVAMHLFCAFQI